MIVRRLFALGLLASLSVRAPVAAVAAPPQDPASILVAQGKWHEANGDDMIAMKRYSDALSIAPESGEAWLALAKLRAKRGELAEAEALCTVGLTHVPLMLDLVLERAHVRRRRGDLAGASEDLRRAWTLNGLDASETEIAILRERVSVEREARASAAELSAWRRLLVIARAKSDATLTKEASVQVRALQLVLGELDPVVGGRALPDASRKTLAAIGRRGG